MVDISKRKTLMSLGQLVTFFWNQTIVHVFVGREEQAQVKYFGRATNMCGIMRDTTTCRALGLSNA